MGDIDWASVFGTLETAGLPSNAQPAQPRTDDPQPPTSQLAGHNQHRHSALHGQNAEAGPSRPHPPSRSHSLPDPAGLDDSAFSLFAHDHASRAWFAAHTEANRHSIAGPSRHVGGQTFDGFAVPLVPPPTPAPLGQSEQYLPPAGSQPFMAYLNTANHLPFLFGQNVLPNANASAGFGMDSPDGGAGLPAMSRPPSTPSSSRPTPNTVLDQEDKRVRNTMASAKFRAKKKQQTEEMQRTVNDLESQKEQLEKDVTSLKQENGLLREIVQLKYGWKADIKKDESASDGGEQHRPL